MCKVLAFNKDCQYRSRRGAKVRELAKRQKRVLVIYEEVVGYVWNCSKGFWKPDSQKGVK